METTKLNPTDADSSVSVTPNKSGSKREATSPLYSDAVSLKKTRPDMLGDSEIAIEDGTRVQELGERHLSADTDVHVLTQPMNPNDIIQIARELRSIMLPELKSIIVEFKPYIKETVTDAVRAATKDLNTELSQLREANTQLTKSNQDLVQKNKDLEKRLSEVERGNDSLEQYSRRNSLRISGYHESPNENTDNIVMSIARELDVQLDDHDIDRSHRVGRLGQKNFNGQPKHRDIIVKFSTYNARHRFYSKRKNLHDIDRFKGVFFNEDLTKSRSKLLFEARTLVRANKLQSAYASDGKIFVRGNDDARHLIKSETDLLEYGDAKEARKELARQSLLRSSHLPAPAGAATGLGGISVDT